MFTLYTYLHCPFCVRAEMAANYSGLAYKNVRLLNDDDDTCIGLVGVKMVPIMQTSDGKAMGESLDIVAQIMSLAGPDKNLLPKQHAAAITDYLQPHSDAINQLVFPRDIMIPQPEFETQSARDYFQRKKEKAMGNSFANAFANASIYIQQINHMLAKLPLIPLPSERHNQLSWDDFYLFPTLRNLTMVKGLVWPAPVKAYVDEIAALANIHLYFEQAV